MNVREIIIDYLKANGYDGLCTIGCGCEHYQSCSADIEIGETCYYNKEATNESQD